MYSSGKVVGGTVRQVTSGAQVRRCYVRIRNRSGTGGHERSRHVTDVGSIYILRTWMGKAAFPKLERAEGRDPYYYAWSDLVLATPISVHCNCH